MTPTVKPSLAPTKRPTSTPVVPTSLPTIKLTPTVTFVPCSKKSIGDANCDGVVSIMDFGIWKTEFSGNVNQKTADFDGNGRVSIIDFGIWKTGFLERS